MRCLHDPKVFSEALSPAFLLFPALGCCLGCLRAAEVSWGWFGGILYLADFVLVRLGFPCPCLPKGDRAQVSPDAPWLLTHLCVLGAGGQSQGCTQVLSPCPIQGAVAFPGLCPDTSPLARPQPAGAMRCSLKRSLTVLLAVSFLLLLLLHGSSRQEQDPLEVSAQPETSHWRGWWSILYPFLPRMNPNLSSALFPAPCHPNTPPRSPLPRAALGRWTPLNPGAGRAGQGLPFAFGSLSCHPPLLTGALGCDLLPVAPMQVQLRGLAPDTILQLLQPEGAQHILRDTAELSALHNISYQLLAGSPAPRKSEWSWTLWVCTSGCAQLHIPAQTCPLSAAGAGRGWVLPIWVGTCPQPPQPSLLTLGMEELGKLHVLHAGSRLLHLGTG